MAGAYMSSAIFAFAGVQERIAGPEGLTVVSIVTEGPKAYYQVEHAGRLMVGTSPLGLVTDAFDFSELEFVKSEQEQLHETYSLDRIKTSSVDYHAVKALCTFRNPEGRRIDVEFRIGKNYVAFRYVIPREGETGSVRILDELTGFTFEDTPSHDRIRTYLTPQSDAMIGWKRTKPSYEEYYGVGLPVTAPSEYGHGYTFPCLFKIGDDGWVLVSETGVDGRFCGSRLGEYMPVGNVSEGYAGAGYEIEYPMQEENNGNGTSEPAIALPGSTPWRTLTLGTTLKPVVETTAVWDVVEPLYETSHDYELGKGTWSWIVWQDASICMADQKKYIDLASAMGFDYTLVDNWWDRTIGRDGIEELIAYADDWNVDLFLWYSSSGWWNDIEQSPVNIMSNPILRKKEMRWLQEAGVKGIKVDFFGGDKQETMALYEAILSDADDHGLMVIFHGCTLPRGWERMYPNYVGSEAVRASENLVFFQEECDQEAVAACLHPFIRNTVGCMEFGGCFMNERLDRTNMNGTVRRTTDVFQLATCVLFQNPIQNFALAPNNLEDAPQVCLDFLREVPVVWDETVYVDGVPGEYVVLARRSGERWYVGAINAIGKPLEVKVKDVLEAVGAGSSSVTVITGGNEPERKEVKAKASLTLDRNDGAVLMF